MDGEPCPFIRRMLDESGDHRDAAARREDNDIVFPSIKLANDAVLGCFLTEGLMQVFKDMVHRKYKSDKRKELDKIPVVFKPTDDASINQSATKELMDLIGDAKRFHSSTRIYSNSYGLSICLPRRLPFREDLCQIFKIPDTDPRIKLRGQLGVRATSFIPMYTVLGIYRGLILPRYVTDNNLVRNPRQNWQGTVQEWECELRRYMMETDLHVTNPATGKQETIPLDISPYGYNSPGGLINDPRIITEHPVHLDPYLSGEKVRFSTDDLEPPQVVAPENTTVLSAYVFGFPFAVVITVRPLIAGEELLFNYGRDHFLMPGHFPQPNGLD